MLPSHVYFLCVLVTQVCLTLCNPMDCSSLDSSVHGILQAGILEWVAISFSNVHGVVKSWAWLGDWTTVGLLQNVPEAVVHVVVQSPSHVWLFTTPWTTARQASLSLIISWSFPKSYPLNQWCHPTISSSVALFSSCLQSFPASRSLLLSQFLTSGGQSIRTLASASVLPVNNQGWFPLTLTGLIPCSPGDSKKPSPALHFKSTTASKLLDFWCFHTMLLNDRNLFSHSSGVQKSEVKVLAGLVSSESTLLDLQTAVFSPFLYNVFPLSLYLFS